MRGEMSDWQDPRLIRAASHLSPAVIRVGGITADFVQYTPDDGPSGQPTEPEPPRALPMPMERTVPPRPRPMKGFWPTGPEGNLSIGLLGNLTDFFAAANLSLMLDLNELHGRDCHTVKPGCPSANPGCHVRFASSLLFIVVGATCPCLGATLYTRPAGTLSASRESALRRALGRVRVHHVVRNGYSGAPLEPTCWRLTPS